MYQTVEINQWDNTNNGNSTGIIIEDFHKNVLHRREAKMHITSGQAVVQFSEIYKVLRWSKYYQAEFYLTALKFLFTCSCHNLHLILLCVYG